VTTTICRTLLTDDPECPMRLRVERDPADGLVAIAEDSLTSRSEGAQVTRERTIWLTTAEALWMRGALAEVRPTRGELINRKATAGAVLVRAEEALAKAEKASRARCTSETRAAAVAQARRDEAMLTYLEASTALDAAGGP
jgi:hypothetical protein